MGKRPSSEWTPALLLLRGTPSRVLYNLLVNLFIGLFSDWIREPQTSEPYNRTGFTSASNNLRKSGMFFRSARTSRLEYTLYRAFRAFLYRMSAALTKEPVLDISIPR